MRKSGKRGGVGFIPKYNILNFNKPVYFDKRQNAAGYKFLDK
jgi:hypothetical protein